MAKMQVVGQQQRERKNECTRGSGIMPRLGRPMIDTLRLCPQWWDAMHFSGMQGATCFGSFGNYLSRGSSSEFRIVPPLPPLLQQLELSRTLD